MKHKGNLFNEDWVQIRLRVRFWWRRASSWNCTVIAVLYGFSCLFTFTPYKVIENQSAKTSVLCVCEATYENWTSRFLFLPLLCLFFFCLRHVSYRDSSSAPSSHPCAKGQLSKWDLAPWELLLGKTCLFCLTSWKAKCPICKAKVAGFRVKLPKK